MIVRPFNAATENNPHLDDGPIHFFFCVAKCVYIYIYLYIYVYVYIYMYIYIYAVDFIWYIAHLTRCSYLVLQSPSGFWGLTSFSKAALAFSS